MSSGYVETATRTFQATSALAAGLRVKLTAGKLVAAGVSDLGIGTLERAALAADEYVPVRLWTAQGTRMMVASAAVTQFASVYAAADGKCDDTDTNLFLGVALQAATANNDLIEVLPLPVTEYAANDQTITIDPTRLRTWDALATNLPGTAANDDLALITGTPATDGPTVQCGDIGGATSSRIAGLLFALPADYQAGDAVTLRLHAGMITSVCDTSCTVDVNAYECSAAGAAGADICATAAQSMNSLTYADLDFTITPTNLVAGDLLSIVITIAYADTANAAVMIPEISRMTVLINTP